MKLSINTFYIVLTAIFTLPGLTSCQKVISVDIGNTSPQLVIEGNLTNQTGVQTVTLSKSVSYNDANVYPTVSGAIITLNDGSTTTYKFIETKPGTYTNSVIKGKANVFYVLTVQYGGQSYYAGSTMPAQVNLDSLTLQSQGFGNKNVITVVVNYTDPPGIANQYRFIMYVNGVQVNRVFTENDQLSDGKKSTSVLYEQDITLKSGDKVDVDMQCIDPAIYNYWNSLSIQGGNTPQNSSTPSNPPSNFYNSDVLGYFSAHTIQRKSVVIP